MQLFLSSTNADEGNNGSIDLDVAFGIPPYSFNWSNGASTEDLTNLAAGLYNVTVTDANGCEASGSANVGGGEYCLLRASNTNYEWIDRVYPGKETLM